MALWKYQDSNGNWNEAAGREIIALAGSGAITPETLIESPNGKRTVAGKLQLKNEPLFKNNPAGGTGSSTKVEMTDDDFASAMLHGDANYMSSLSAQYPTIPEGFEQQALSYRPAVHTANSMNISQRRKTVFGTTVTIFVAIISVWFLAVLILPVPEHLQDGNVSGTKGLVVCVGIAFVVLCLICIRFFPSFQNRTNIFSSTIGQISAAFGSVFICLTVSVIIMAFCFALIQPSTPARSWSIDDELASTLRDFDRETELLEMTWQSEHRIRLADARILPNEPDRNYETRMADNDLSHKRRMRQIDRNALERQFIVEKGSQQMRLQSNR